MNAIRRLAFVFGRWNRYRKAVFAERLGQRLRVRTVLLVGVAGTRGPVDNLIEDHLAERFEFVVASGITSEAQGWPAYVVADGRALPFADGSFDLVYANAVIEHVGGKAEQHQFASELQRVGRLWIITTPNRWFPVESHFHTLFTHWFRGWAPRGTVTRLLGRRSLGSLVDGGRVRGLPVLSPTLTAYGTGTVVRSPSHNSVAGSADGAVGCVKPTS